MPSKQRQGGDVLVAIFVDDFYNLSSVADCTGVVGTGDKTIWKGLFSRLARVGDGRRIGVMNPNPSVFRFGIRLRSLRHLIFHPILRQYQLDLNQFQI